MRVTKLYVKKGCCSMDTRECHESRYLLLAVPEKGSTAKADQRSVVDVVVVRGHVAHGTNRLLGLGG